MGDFIKASQETNSEIYRLAMHSIKDYAVFLISPEGNITSWNIGAELMKQWKAEEIIGQNYAVLFTPEDQANGKPQEELKHSKMRGLFEEEHERMRKDGSFFKANVTLTALYDDKGNHYGFVKITRDITDRVEAERKLLTSEAELSEALKARDEFLSIASHELKTPLTSLKLQCEFMVRKISKGVKQSAENFEKFSKNTSEMVDKLNRLVDEMLDISRIESSRLTLKKESILICDCIKGVLEQLEPVFHMADYEIPVIENCQDIEGEFDKFRLEQVFNNILTNAIRYGDGKPVTVRADMINGMALITIQDQGIGIAKEKIEKMFGRFERGDEKRASQGLGLGLYIARQIIEAHAGKIWVESELGKGSTFFIQLPLFHELENISAKNQAGFVKDLL
jgi:PAS domain S-box-containing protein